jgi:hypothetical protein
VSEGSDPIGAILLSSLKNQIKKTKATSAANNISENAKT